MKPMRRRRPSRSSGDSQPISREGSGRASSLSRMARLTRQATWRAVAGALGAGERCRDIQTADLLGVGFAHRLRIGQAGPCAITASRSQISNSSSSSSDTTRTPTPFVAQVEQRLADLNAAAPTSTPHVGCAAIIMFGCWRISRPTMNFCRLPPDRLRASASGPPHFTPYSLMRVDRELPRRRERDEAARHHSLPVRREQRIVGERHLAARRRGQAAPPARSAKPSARRCAASMRPPVDAARA